ncbi:zinc-ribbon domain-containing protein [Crocinitomicaceae bacterium]|nr:zinc-ribbon domain-containing protein [Crocinitomicaceae bacterium]
MPRKPPPGKSLAEVNPELAKEWHPTKNGELTSYDVTSGSDKKVWWQCKKGNDHEWEAFVNNRSKGQGCPFCSGRRASKLNNLEIKNPKISRQWDSAKNYPISPNNVTPNSSKKYWWKCSKGHSFESSVANRVKAPGCPFCSGRKVSDENNLLIENPVLASEWHPSLNGSLQPSQVTKSSSKNVWWQCAKNKKHVWQSTVNNRSRRGCPFCGGRKVNETNSLLTCRPELAKEWHPSKNNKVTPSEVTEFSNKKVWWKCKKSNEHEWQATIANRSGGHGCPYCSNQLIAKGNSFAETDPEYLKYWHPHKNGNIVPTSLSSGSGIEVWWICDKDRTHEWKASVYDTIKGGYGCRVCSGRKVIPSSSLKATHPEICKEWHPTKNKLLSPISISHGSTKLVWWKCDKGEDHEWKASPNRRTSQKGKCPICEGKKVVKSNSLDFLYPELSKEWHPTKNKLTPSAYTAHSSKKVYWQCSKGEDHFWSTSISHRTSEINPTGCPFCFLTPQSRQELTVTFELLTIFKGINPKGFKIRVNGKLWSIDTFIPSLNLGIEFDGAYWHKDKAQLDKVKTEKIEETGLNIIRVRQKPLERLFEDDVMAEKKFDGKQITNDILRQIVKDDGKYAYKLNKRILDKIDKYLKLKELQNEKGLDKYIDQILTEKAERKK